MTLKYLLDYITEVNPKISIENFNSITGEVSLNNKQTFNLNDIKDTKDVDQYLTGTITLSKKMPDMLELHYNLKLRQKILVCALELESGITDILLNCFNVNKSDSLAAFGNKGSNISYQNKLDILKDIDVLVLVKSNDKKKAIDEYNPFKTVMNYRNKFLHVSECNSFSKAAELIDKDKYISKQKEVKKDETIEGNLKKEFEEAYENCIKIIQDKLKLVTEVKTERSRKIGNLIGGLNTVRDGQEDLFNKMNEIFKIQDGDSVEMVDYKQFCAAEMHRLHSFSDVILKVVYEDFDKEGVLENYSEELTTPKYINKKR